MKRFALAGRGVILRASGSYGRLAASRLLDDGWSVARDSALCPRPHSHLPGPRHFHHGLLALVLTTAAVGCQPPPRAPFDVDLEVREQRASYAVGLDVARNLSQQDLPIELEALLAGLRDGLTDQAKLEGQDAVAALMDFRALISERMAADIGPEGEANLAAGSAFLARNTERPGVQVTASGLQYEVVREGTGPRPGPGDTVRVHYRGTTIDGEMFDESYGGDPAVFAVGQVIPGWTEGLQLMPVGSKFLFWIPAEIGYGTSPPRGATFGPNATLAFEVELLEIL